MSSPPPPADRPEDPDEAAHDGDQHAGEQPPDGTDAGPPPPGEPPPGEPPPPDQPPPGEAWGTAPTYSSAPTSDERSLSVVAHLLGLTSLLGIPGFIGPLILFLTRRHLNVPSVDHAREALNFNLSIALYTIAGGILAFVLTIVTVGIALIAIIPVAIAFGIFAIGAPCYAAYQASQGVWWDYPLTIRFFSR